MNVERIRDPLILQQVNWPHATFTDYQRDIVRSVWENRYTFVPAAQKMGKDYIAAYICLAFFLTRPECRIVNTSAKDDHLVVLWGEMTRWINTSKYPLRDKEGGPLIVKHREINKIIAGKKCALSYIKGMVAADDSVAAMGGHHIATTNPSEPRTLFVGDECSSVNDEYEEKASPWAHRLLFIGNTWDCKNFWYDGIEKGDVPRDDGRGGFYAKVIRVPADRSPNVRYAMAEIESGKKPSGRIIVPGVKDWWEYQEDRKHLDEVNQCVRLDAQFYKGKELRLFPPTWLVHAERLARKYRGTRRKARAIGIDPAEGGDKTAICAVDDRGVIELLSCKTPDTNQIPGMVIAFGLKHKVDPSDWVFDRGGGGKQHADRLRDLGYNVRTVAFGEAPTEPIKPSVTLYDDRIENAESRGAFVNRRAEMYGTLSQLMDPSRGIGNDNEIGFAIPAEYAELFKQLGPIPKLYDGEGKLRLPPKHKKDPKSKEVSLTELIGHSPDEADALVLAVFGMMVPSSIPYVGAV